MDLLKCFTVLCSVLIFAHASKVKLLERCTSSEDCPRRAKCRERGCDRTICLCDDGLMPSQGDNATCVDIAEIGENCDNLRRCRGLYSRCNDNQKCVCSHGYTQIKVMNINYCKQNPVFETEPLLLGQNCDREKTFCSDSFQTTTCKNKVCQCINGYRPANKTEVNLYPFRLLQCVPITFTINQPFPPSLCIQVQPVTKTIQQSTSANVPTYYQSPMSSETSMSTSTEQTSMYVSTISSKSTITAKTSSSNSITSAVIASTDFVHKTTNSSFVTVKPTTISTELIPGRLSSLFVGSNVIGSMTKGVVTPTKSISPLQSVPNTLHVSLSGNQYTTANCSSCQTVVPSQSAHLMTSSASHNGYHIHPSSTLTHPIVSKGNFNSYMPPEPNSMTSSQIVINQSIVTKSFSYLSPLRSSHQPVSIGPSIILETSMVFTPSITIRPVNSKTSIDKEKSLSSDIDIITVTGGISFTTIIDIGPRSTSPAISTGPASTLSSHRYIHSTRTDRPTTLTTTSTPSIKGYSSTTGGLSKTTGNASIKTHSSSITTLISSTAVYSLSSTTSSLMTTMTGSSSSQKENTLPNAQTTESLVTAGPVTVKTVLDGVTCNATHKCAEHGICEEDKCGLPRCRCQKGYRPDINKEIYVMLRKLGEECNNHVACIGPFTTCKAGVCQCKDDYVASSDGMWCTHRTSWFIKFPLLGDRCMSFFAECFHASEQECEKGTCRCKHLLREADEIDLNITSSLYYQCRNGSTSLGFREPRDCGEDTEDINTDPNYHGAIKRIRKMQGIIFGIIAGVVVAVCTLIGGLFYCRYRKRHVIKDMTSDNGSMVSFDRQSSGKYSFRLPRPFLPYIKDWDTHNVSYANSAFTADENDVPKENNFPNGNADDIPNGNRTLRSSRSITLPDSDTEGYNRPSERQLSISTSSTIDAELSDIEQHSNIDSPASILKSYQTNHIDPENVEV